MKRSKKKILCLVLLAALLAVAVLLFANPAKLSVYSSAKELKGKKIGALSGSATIKMVENYYDGDISIEYYTMEQDMPIALQTGKIDAYISNLYTARRLCTIYTNQTVLEETPIQSNPVGYMFTPNDEIGQTLCAQMNEMIAESMDSGLITQLTEKWVEQTDWVIDIPLSGENGTLRFACCSSIGFPFCSMKNNRLVGCDIELAYLFCQRYGYDLEITDYDQSGMIAAVSSGKANFGGTNTCISEERKKQCLFSEPYRYIAFPLVVNSGEVQSSDTNFLQGIADSFYNNFILENRWQLVLSGIGVTLLITVSAVLMGSAIGLTVFLFSYNGSKRLNRFIDVCMWLVHGMPVVVFLMVLFYLLLGHTAWSGFAISIIAFTIIFACACIKMLRSSYHAIPKGQTEAALALGYTPFQTVWYRLLPQMIVHLTPVFEGEIVSLLKATAVVGYIAVQDLTKAGDIIRGCTYEAFFPLIATTVLYFILAALLKSLATKALQRFDLRRRSRKQILKGVQSK